MSHNGFVAIRLMLHFFIILQKGCVYCHYIVKTEKFLNLKAYDKSLFKKLKDSTFYYDIFNTFVNMIIVNRLGNFQTCSYIPI